MSVLISISLNKEELVIIMANNRYITFSVSQNYNVYHILKTADSLYRSCFKVVPHYPLKRVENILKFTQNSSCANTLHF